MKYKGIILGVGALLINFVFSQFPILADTVYYKGIFQVIRCTYDHTLGFLPFPAVYLLFGFLVWWLGQRLGVIWDALIAKKPIKSKSINILSSILNPLGWIIFSFYILWGYNYQRTPFEKRMRFEKVSPDTTYLYDETIKVMDILVQKRGEILSDSASFTMKNLPKNIESLLREEQELIIAKWGEPTLGRVRIRKLSPKGTLLRIATSGVYIPFVCEGHVDKGLHPLQYPFTMAHEMAHGYGYTDEGVCNFVGFVTCMRSKNKMIAYSGLLGYYRYLLSNLRTSATYSYKELRRKTPTSIQLDLNDIADEMDKYPDIFPDVRNAVYDSYLKSHGVKEGIANYNDIVRLVAQWQRNGGNY